jgi:hypothetical protein
MRKSEMTPAQIEERSTVVELLGRAGWTGSLDHEMFEKGRYCDPEASMEYRNAFGMHLEVDYLAESRWLMLSVRGDGEEMLDVGICFGDQLTAVLAQIIAAQDQVSPSRYKELLRQLLSIVPSGVLIASGNGFVPLTDGAGAPSPRS